MPTICEFPIQRTCDFEIRISQQIIPEALILDNSLFCYHYHRRNLLSCNPLTESVYNEQSQEICYVVFSAAQPFVSISYNKDEGKLLHDDFP